MIIHTNGNHRYASTKPYTIGEDGIKRYTYKHWGTLDEQNRFIPGMAYMYASIEEREQLIFPKDWDLSQIETISGTKRRGRIVYEAEDVDRQFGPTWLLNQVAVKTGLLDDLRSVFSGNMEMVNDILTLAYFPFIDNLSYNQLSQWQREVKAPSGRDLNSVNITRLAQSITEQNRMDIFRCRAARLGKDDLCAVDSTSMPTYGFNLVDIRWGRNKEHLPLRQTVELVVYSLTTHMPIYYKELPGNMPDVRTIELIMIELRHAGFKNLVLITDRGYESVKNLELYISRGQKVITSVKVSQGDVLKKIKEIDMSHGYPKGMTLAKKENLYYAQYGMDYTVHGKGDALIKADKYRLNLYFNPAKRAEAMCDIQHAVDEQAEAAQAMMETGEPVSDRDEIKKRFNMLFIKFEANNRIASFEVNREKQDALLLTAGFFASKTIGVDLDPLAARDNYGMRDEQEEAFALQKGALGQDRLRTWSETSKHGRMFITFIGLILASYVRATWKGNEVLKKKFGSTEAVLAEMRTIRYIEHSGKFKFITPFVGAQIDICKAFGCTRPLLLGQKSQNG